MVLELYHPFGVLVCWIIDVLELCYRLGVFVLMRIFDVIYKYESRRDEIIIEKIFQILTPKG